MNATMLLQATLSGLAVGSIYALVALGFSITFTTSKTLNFSQGEFVSAGSFLYIGCAALLGALPLGADAAALLTAKQLLAVVGSLSFMALLGGLLYIVGVRPFVGKPGLSWVISTLGFGIVLQSAGLAIWGPGNVLVPSPVGDGLVNVLGASMRRQELLVIGVAFTVMLALHWTTQRTMVGKVMRAVAQSGKLAMLMGINVKWVIFGAFAASSILAALSGILIAPIATASIYLGLAYGLKGFSAAIVGGLTNPRGCVIGGLALGVLESLVNLWQAQWKDVVVFSLVIVILAIRPSGLFGGDAVEKA